MAHLLSMIEYQDLVPEIPKLPALGDIGGYVRSPMHDQTFVPQKY
jgi:hypothetical protein